GMKWSLSAARTSGSAQVSLFMVWHHGHHQLCSDTITNFFSAAARAKVASDQSLQKPSRLSSGAAWAAASPSITAMKAPNQTVSRIMKVSTAGTPSRHLQAGPFGGPITAKHRIGRTQEGSVAITVQPITPDFAAEVGDVVLGKPLAAQDLAAIRAAFTKYAVLVFPDQEFDDDSQLDFARCF